MSKIIGVIGCGWLGLPLAISFVKEEYTVHGSTTSEEKVAYLAKEGITPFLISLAEDEIKGNITGFLQNLDALVINVPPKLRGKGPKENYVKKMHLLHQEIKQANIDKVIFVSSTSVYGDIDGEVTENTIPEPSTESGKQLLVSENIFAKDIDLQTTIIRFGGLIGPNRHPVTMLSKKQGLSNGNAPVNLIHLNDCIRIINAVFKNSWWNLVLNGVYPQHPTKQNYYSLEAKKRKIQMPDYKVNKHKKGKIIYSNVLISVKNFKFTTTL